MVLNTASGIPLMPIPTLSTGQSSENHIGEIGHASALLSITPAITAGAYSANDIVGAIQTLTGAMRIAGGIGVLQSLVITDLAKQNVAINVFYFDRNPTNGTYTDNIPLDIDDADMVFCIGVAKILATDYVDSANSSVAMIKNIGLGVKANAGVDLYAIAMTVGTPTYVSTSDLSFKHYLLQD